MPRGAPFEEYLAGFEEVARNERGEVDPGRDEVVTDDGRVYTEDVEDFLRDGRDFAAGHETTAVEGLVGVVPGEALAGDDLDRRAHAMVAGGRRFHEHCNPPVTVEAQCNEAVQQALDPGTIGGNLSRSHRNIPYDAPRPSFGRLHIDTDSMKANDKLHRPSGPDQSLRYTMRFIGFILAAASTFFLTQDLGQAATSTTVFFLVGAILGTITVLTSWLPSPESSRLQEAPVRGMSGTRR